MNEHKKLSDVEISLLLQEAWVGFSDENLDEKRAQEEELEKRMKAFKEFSKKAEKQSPPSKDHLNN